MRIVAILTTGAALLISCVSSVRLHHFVIPRGYTGPIAVVSDSSFSGSGSYWEGERYVHRAPLTAVVCVSPDKRLRAHLLSAEYSDGSAIYSYGMGRVHPPTENSIRIEAFGAWHGGSDNSSVTWLGVGDAKTVEALKRSFFGNGIEKSMPPNVRVERIDLSVTSDFKQLRPYCAA